MKYIITTLGSQVQVYPLENHPKNARFGIRLISNPNVFGAATERLITDLAISKEAAIALHDILGGFLYGEESSANPED